MIENLREMKGECLDESDLENSEMVRCLRRMVDGERLDTRRDRNSYLECPDGLARKDEIVKVKRVKSSLACSNKSRIKRSPRFGSFLKNSIVSEEDVYNQRFIRMRLFKKRAGHSKKSTKTRKIIIEIHASILCAGTTKVISPRWTHDRSECAGRPD